MRWLKEIIIMKNDRFFIGKQVIICAFVILSFAAEVIGATYYVSPTGSDSSSGNKNAPFRNIQKAADVVKPGDTVIVKDGNYTDHNNDNWVLRIRKGGSPGRVITFIAENKHRAVIDGKNFSTGYGIDIDAPFIKVAGFKITKVSKHGLFAHQKAHDVEISNNEFHHIAMINTDTSYGHTGIYISPYAYNLTIDRNLFHDIGRNDTGCEHCYRHDHGIYAQGRFITITNNIFYNFWAGWALTVRGHIGDAGSTPTHVVINNTFAYNTRPDAAARGHIRFYINPGTNPMKNVIIENNIFFSEPGNTAISMSRDTKAVGTIVRNNATDSPNICSENLGSDVTKYLNSDYKTANVVSLPKASFNMTNPAENDFTLNPNATHLIDKGYEGNGGDQFTSAPDPPKGLKVLQ
jgi:hypothetical protein